MPARRVSVEGPPPAAELSMAKIRFRSHSLTASVLRADIVVVEGGSPRTEVGAGQPPHRFAPVAGAVTIRADVAEPSSRYR